MKQRQTLYSRYPDLLPTKPDPALEQLIGDFDRLSNQPQPPVELVEMKVAHSLQARQAETGLEVGSSLDLGHKWLEVGSPRRVSRIIIWGVGLTVLLLSGAVIFWQVYSNRYYYNKGGILLQPICKVDTTFKQLERGIQIGGCTNFEIYQVTADSDRITISYNYSGPNNLYYTLSDLKLTDEAGREYKRIGGVVGGFNSKREYSSYGEEWFDATSIQSLSGGTNLQLRLQVGSFQPQGNFQKGPVVGPFSINLSTRLSSQPSRQAVLNQPDTSNGQTVTLEKVVVTPEYARLYLRGLPGDTTDYQEYQLTAGDFTNGYGPSNGAGINGSFQATTSPDGLTVLNLSMPALFDKPGQWSLLITNRNGPTGPWFFRFQLPAAGAKVAGPTPTSILAAPRPPVSTPTLVPSKPVAPSPPPKP